MKFSTRLTLITILLVALCAGVLSSILLQQSFDTMLQASCEQYSRTQAAICQSLADALAQLEADAGIGEEAMALRDAAEQLGSRLGKQYGLLYVRRASGAPLYISLPIGVTEADAAAALAGDWQQHTVLQSGSSRYAGFAGGFACGGQQYQVYTLCDVTAVFRYHAAARTRAVGVTAALVGAAALAVWAICTALTRPIRRLDAAAAAIAAGDYKRRSGVQGADEIASLAASFDHMADTVQANIDELQLNLERQQQFVAAFTHELKTPMTAMMGYADLLRSQVCDADTTRLAAGYIYSETDRLANLSQSLLMLQGLAGEQPELAPTDWDALVEALRRTLPMPDGMQLRTEGPAGVTVLAEQALALVLLRNLVTNALRAQPRDCAVHLCWQQAEATLQVQVRDTGCGIPAADLPHITQPFYMVDKSRARAGGGSGVGLAICSRIMALHGGELCFESEVGVGTAVRFALMLAEQHESEMF